MSYNNNNAGMHIVMRSAYGGYGYVPYVDYGTKQTSPNTLNPGTNSGKVLSRAERNQRIKDCRRDLAYASERLKKRKAELKQLPNLIGKRVTHIELGTGIVTAFDDDKITIDYHGTKKRYQASLAFSKGTLKCNGYSADSAAYNAKIQKKIKELTSYIKDKEAELDNLMKGK